MSEDQEPEPSRQQNRRWEERNARGKLTTETARGIGIRGRAGCGAGVGEAAGVVREREGWEGGGEEQTIFFFSIFILTQAGCGGCGTGTTVGPWGLSAVSGQAARNLETAQAPLFGLLFFLLDLEKKN